jgi:hypothetical protein
MFGRYCQGAVKVPLRVSRYANSQSRHFGIDSFRTHDPKLLIERIDFVVQQKYLLYTGVVHKPRNRTWEEESSLTTFTMTTAADASSRHIDSNNACAAVLQYIGSVSLRVDI